MLSYHIISYKQPALLLTFFIADITYDWNYFRIKYFLTVFKKRVIIQEK